MELNHAKFAASLDTDYPGIGGLWDFAINRLRPLESPLEVQFLAQWMIQTYESGVCSYAGEMYDPQAPRVFDLVSQPWIGNVRLDFGITLYADDGDQLAYLSVETDGFAYHSDRTRFESDRERDQILQAKGITCFRYTKRLLGLPDPLANIIEWSGLKRPVAPFFRSGERQIVKSNGGLTKALTGKYEVEAQIIAAKGDPTDMKSRIMTAWEHGHLTPEEAEAWIVAWGLEAA